MNSRPKCSGIPRALLPWLPMLLTACVPSDGGFSDVRTTVHDRVGHRIEWRRVDAGADPNVAPARAKVQKILEQPLTVDGTTRIALLNNRELQGALADLGLARAALIQASLLPNPEIEAELKFPKQGEAGIDLGIGLNLSDVIFLSLEHDAASAELEAAKLGAAGVVLDFTFDVRRAFYGHQSAMQQLELWRSVHAAAAAAFEAARGLYEAGNINALDLANERALYEEANLMVAKLESDLFDRREDLNVLMGLWGDDVQWRATDRLADPPEDALTFENLEQQVIDRSLDLGRLKYRLEASAARVGVARGRGLLPHLEIGAVAEREDGSWAVGPRVSMQLPLFDHGQGRTATQLAQLDGLREQYAAMAVRLRSAARKARNRVGIARERAVYIRRVLMPLKERIVHETQLQYNAMSTGVFQLLGAKRDQIDTGRRYVEALHDYWMARAVMDQLLAGRMAGAQSAAMASSSEPMMAAGGGGH